MGEEVIIYGRIDGAPWRTNDDDYRRLQNKNAVVFYQLPLTDDWPWLVRGMFSLPAPWPQGTFRRQVMHFGGSFKDDAFDADVWDRWLAKFEAVLGRLYWTSAVVHVEVDAGPPRTWRWVPSGVALDRMMRSNDPPPVREWTRTDPPPG